MTPLEQLYAIAQQGHSLTIRFGRHGQPILVCVSYYPDSNASLPAFTVYDIATTLEASVHGCLEKIRAQREIAQGATAVSDTMTE